MKKACVVIPLYKDQLSSTEEMSLKQCFKILGKHQIFFAIPRRLEAILATDFWRTWGADYKTFDDHFFEKIQGYNKLMKSPTFYKAFRDYEFMLIYQLDAFVFKDELIYWCNQNFDYIGAPFIDLTENGQPEIKGQGNGGFSLRKTEKFYHVVTQFKRLGFKHPYFDPAQPFYINLWRDLRYNLIYNFSYYPFQSIVNEDVFWAEYIPLAFNDFEVPPPIVAIPFSFEESPSYLYGINHDQLPFGCHGWMKYEPDFWKPHFKEAGYEI